MNKFLKKGLALLLTLCMLCPAAAIGVSSADTAPAFTAPSIWKTSGKSLGVNKIYTTGLVAAGTILSKVAAATECEELEKIASFINVWICGGNPTTQTLAEIKALCNQILNELKIIEQKMDSYATYFATQDAQDKYDLLVKEMNKAWADDVEDTISQYGLHSAMLDFFEYEDLTEISDNDTNRNIGYVAAASCYKNSVSDKYGHYYTEAELEKLREVLFEDFCRMYSAMPSTANTHEKKAEILFSTNYIDTQMQSAIRQLSSDINKADSYADRCAQVAYQSMPNLSDQYEFVRNCVNRQFMQICMVELLYQEYLSMRGEYLEYKYDQAMQSKDKATADVLLAENKTMWEAYYNDISFFAKCNEELLGYMENRISKPLQLDTYITLALDKYITPQDMGSIVLQNTGYKERTDSDDNPKSYNGYDSSATFTKEFMRFNRFAVPTQEGVKTYYILDAATKDSTINGITADNAKTKNMIHRFDRNLLDLYYSSCDAYNLRLCTYTDSINSYVCPSSPADIESLYKTDSFAFYSSTPQAYLGEFLSYVPSDKRVYQFFNKSEIDYTADGMLTDDHIIYDTLDMSSSYVGFDTGTNLVEKVNGKVVYEKDYSKDGYDKNTYDSYYSIILKEKDQQLKSRISLYITGDGKADAYITDKAGNRITDTTLVPCADELTLWIKATDPSTIFESLKKLTYNSPVSQVNPVEEEVILTRENFHTLQFDEDTGYYKLNFTMPYSSATLELSTSKGYSISYENSITKTPVTFFTYDNAHKAGDNISFIYNGRLNHVYLVTAQEITPVNLSYSYATDNSFGSFVMPEGNSTLLVLSSSFTDSNYTLPQVVDGTFSISGYEDLLCASAFINSGNPLYTNARYVLTKDLDMTGKSFSPIKSFSGTFDGQGYSLKGLHADTETPDGNRHPLFCMIEQEGVVRNLIIDNAQIFSSEYYVAGAGAISKQNYGTIENCLVKNSCIQLGNWNYLGGITGYNKGTIRNCGIADSELVRRWGGADSKPMGGLTQINDGRIENCFVYNCTFTNGTLQNNVMMVSGMYSPTNSFYTPSDNARNTYYTEKPAECFNSGEIAYLLNNSVTDSTQSWYQNIDYGNADAYPVPFRNHGTVYRISDSMYSNSPSIGSVIPPVTEGNTAPDNPTNPESSTDSTHTPEKDIVDTGMHLSLVLISFAVFLSIAFVLFIKKRKAQTD
ncbi:MAG: hypothetical protein E7563_06905 [Ruminococcaceae bacterium]|nr:hypothetical protein [Oscillospiraceae bacterium]